MSAEADGVDGFIDRLDRPPTSSGALDGLTFGLKDLYDVAGRVAGCGNPDWLKTHEPAERDCPVLARLLAAGASLAGITHTDELAYSLNGENHHYGTPRNPAAVGRVPGGSSSGSASVTAAGEVDFAIGSDTGGSVRVPATYCGLYGIRTTHGAVDLSDCMPLAPSYDTCGWFARDAAVMMQVGDVLLEGEASRKGLDDVRWLMDPALFRLCDDATSGAMIRKLARLGVNIVQTDIGFDPEGWKEAFRIIQASEIWQVHGDWITEVQPTFGPGVKDRFEMASGINQDEVAAMQPIRDHITSMMTDLLGDDGVLLLPTSPGPAPVVNWDPKLLDDFRYRVIALTCIAGHAGLPQVTMPAGEADGAPVGLSIIGPRGSDSWLLGLAQQLS
jgi:amidase